MQKMLGTTRLRSIAGEWRGFEGDYGTYRRKGLEEEAQSEGLSIWSAPNPPNPRYGALLTHATRTVV